MIKIARSISLAREKKMQLLLLIVFIALTYLQDKTRKGTPNLWGEELNELIFPRIFQMSKQRTCLSNITIFRKPFQ